MKPHYAANHKLSENCLREDISTAKKYMPELAGEKETVTLCRFMEKNCPDQFGNGVSSFILGVCEDWRDGLIETKIALRSIKRMIAVCYKPDISKLDRLLFETGFKVYLGKGKKAGEPSLKPHLRVVR